jgi:hypothetical protein
MAVNQNGNFQEGENDILRKSSKKKVSTSTLDKIAPSSERVVAPTNIDPSAKKQADLEKRLQREITAPTVARSDVRDVQTNIPGEFRQTQRNLAQALEAQARGEGPSLAQQQLKMGSDRALSQQLAMAAQARTPAQGALAQRLAMRQAGEQQQALAGQSAMTRLAEQGQAQQLLGQVAGAARGQDLQGAGLEQQAGMANQQVDLATLLANQQATLGAEGLRNQLLGMETGLFTGQQQLDQQLDIYNASAADARAAQRAQANQAEKSAILGGLGTIASIPSIRRKL